MNAKLRKRIKVIERLSGINIESATVSKSGHVRLTVIGGRNVTISMTPSCPFAERHAAADIKRVTKSPKNSATNSPAR